MSTWDNFTRQDTQKSDDTDFNNERPHVPDGVYHATCVRVGEPYDKAHEKSGEMQTKFCAEFELAPSGKLREAAILPAFPSLPPKYLDEGYLSEKSNLFKMMKAFGYDMEGRFVVNPPEWPGNVECHVVVENTDASWITKFLACDCETAEEPEPAPPPTPKRQPIGAGAGRAPARDLRKELEG